MKKIPVYLSETELRRLNSWYNFLLHEDCNYPSDDELSIKLKEQSNTFKEFDGPDYENDEIRNIKPDIVYKPVD